MEAYTYKTEYDQNIINWLYSLPIKNGEQIEIIVLSNHEMKKSNTISDSSMIQAENLIATSKKKVPEFGYAKGMFVMSDDFNEPIDDFKDYM